MDLATWRAKAERDLKGRSIERLSYRPEPDVDCGPLCTHAPPSSRGTTRAPGWSIIQTVAGTPDAMARSIQAALSGGVDAIRIQCGTLRDARDLATCLTPVDLKRTPLFLAKEDAGAAAALVGLWRGLGLSDDTVRVHFGLDPLGELATRGGLMGTVEGRLASAAEVARWTSEHVPHSRAITVDSTLWHNAGADEGWSIALGISTAIAYVRAMESAGVPCQSAFSQIAIRQAIPGRFLLGVAKLRATRRIWSRVAELSSVTARLHQTAVPAARERTERDRWVNLLRHTASSFGAIVGGADAVDLPPYSARDAQGERLARNTQLVLRDEAHLDRVADPAGGSFALETLTDQLARAAWKRLQLVEQQGGMVTAITSGFAVEQVRTCRMRLEHQVRTRKHGLLGVSRFPNLQESPPAGEILEEAPTATPGGLEPTANFDELLPGALRSPIGSMTQALGGRGLARAPMAAPFQLADPYEALRARAERQPSRPEIYLATLGPQAEHGPLTQFGVELVETGGLKACVGTAEAFKSSDSGIVILSCARDRLETEGIAAVGALVEKGAAIWCLGRPGSSEAALREAGIKDFFFSGIDAVQALTTLWAEVTR